MTTNLPTAAPANRSAALGSWSARACSRLMRVSNPKAVPGRLTGIGYVEVGRIVLAWEASE